MIMQEAKLAVWRAELWTATECFLLKPTLDGMLAESYITGRSPEGTPFAVAYKMELTADWRMKHLSVFSLLDVHKRLRLVSDFAGHWFNGSREQQFALDGCEFVDIALTPFTNTLPIKRLALTAEPTPVDTIFIDLPSFTVGKTQHFYSKRDEGVFYFQDVKAQTKAEITIDADGLVQEYTGLFKQV